MTSSIASITVDCGNAVDLGGRPASEWVGVLREALAIVERTLPDFRAEIDLILQHVVPVGWDDHAHLSASYRESIGTIYLSLHPNVLTMAEALVHEVSHNKLNALLELDPVLRIGSTDCQSFPAGCGRLERRMPTFFCSCCRDRAIVSACPRVSASGRRASKQRIHPPLSAWVCSWVQAAVASRR